MIAGTAGGAGGTGSTGPPLCLTLPLEVARPALQQAAAVEAATVSLVREVAAVLERAWQEG